MQKMTNHLRREAWNIRGKSLSRGWHLWSCKASQADTWRPNEDHLCGLLAHRGAIEQDLAQGSYNKEANQLLHNFMHAYKYLLSKT
jgi:hypothetical protein